MLGSLVLNLSMKILFEAVRVFQLVSFFILLPVSFTSESKLLMQAIYNFSTFKVISKEVMDTILKKLGFKSFPESELPDINFETNSRRLLGSED